MNHHDLPHPRFQDLSREQAFGLEARVLQRAAPLLVVNSGSSPDAVDAYFSDLLEFTWLLSEIGLGNVSISESKSQGKDFNQRLQYNQLIDKKSVPAADSVLLVTDALGDLGLVDYYVMPGLSSRDQRNPDAGMLVSQCAWTLSKLGMVEEVFWQPTSLDCSFIFEDKRNTDPFLSPEFFSRPLWLTPGLDKPKNGMPFLLETVILEEWKQALRGLGLSGLVVSYEQCLDGMHLSQKNDPIREKPKTMANNVTLNFSSGASFTGPLAVGENIRISYDVAAGASTNELQDRLRETVETVGKLVEKLESESEKVDVSTQLKAFVEEANKEKPSHWMLNTTAKGLMEAATKIASMITPVADAVNAVMKLISP